MEAEKGLAGSVDGGHDSGASAGQLGHLLTWTQERDSEAIVVFTSNNPNILPPEMMRAGRWDALFFFGFPNKKARRDILEIQKKKHDLPELIVTDELVNLTENMSGAELEQFVIECHFVDDVNDLETQKRTISEIPKVYWTKRREIEAILEYGKCLRQASSSDPVEQKLAPREMKRNIDVDKGSSIDDLKKSIKEKIL